MKIKYLLLAIITIFSLQLTMAETGNLTLGDEELRIETSVYPNPSTGTFKLHIAAESSATFKVRVVNLIGQPVVEKEVASNFETTFDLSSQPKGVYFLTLQAGSKKIIKRIVIQ